MPIEVTARLLRKGGVYLCGETVECEITAKNQETDDKQKYSFRFAFSFLSIAYEGSCCFQWCTRPSGLVQRAVALSGSVEQSEGSCVATKRQAGFAAGSERRLHFFHSSQR